MMNAELGQVQELSVEDAESIRGGNPVRAAALLLACFGAGFSFGYSTLGPAIFGD